VLSGRGRDFTRFSCIIFAADKAAIKLMAGIRLTQIKANSLSCFSLL